MEKDNVYLMVDGKVVGTANGVEEISLNNMTEFGNAEGLELDNVYVEKIIMDIRESEKELRVKYVLSKGDLEIGVDHIGHYFELGSLSTIYNNSFDEGIKNFDKLIDYLDYLYEDSKEEERQQEQNRIEYSREEERKQKKVDDFIDPTT